MLLNIILRHTDIVKFLFEKGAGINWPDSYMGTHYHSKIDSIFLYFHLGRTETVKFLIEKGANVNVVDRDLFTPLHLAAGQGFYA